jgi:hypothetical protein
VDTGVLGSGLGLGSSSSSTNNIINNINNTCYIGSNNTHNETQILITIGLFI